MSERGWDWGEVFSLAIKVAAYLFAAAVFLFVWPRIFAFVERIVQSAMRKTSKRIAAAGGDAAEKSGSGERPSLFAKKRRAFPERAAFDTWQHGGPAAHLSYEDERRERRAAEDILKDAMSDPDAKTFNPVAAVLAKPRSKHVVLADAAKMNEPGPYQKYIEDKWKLE